MSEVIKHAIQKYISLRRKKKEIQDRHKEELKPINEAMTKLELSMQAYMLKTGQQNAKTSEGTAYLSTTVRAKVEDWGAFKEFALAHDLIDMVEHRVSSDSVKEYIEATGSTPPGIAITRDTNCRFKQ